jgi:uncharacterized protein YlxP (DUF503 family)
MIVGSLQIDLMLSESRSLKDKRRVIQSLKRRLQDRFNVSVAEVEHGDLHQRCVLGVAAVSNEQRGMHSMFDSIVDVVRACPEVSLIDYQREFY